MSARPQRRTGRAPGLAVGVLVGLGLLVVTPTAGAGVPGGSPDDVVPAEFTAPSPELVAASIHRWDPAGHVRPLETETSDGAETVVSLDSDILFAIDSAEMSTSATVRIGELVADVPDGAEVSVTSHTDDVGTDEDNRLLSEERAQTVADAVTEARPDLDLMVAGRGESEPVENNSTPEGREANRRVEIRYGG
ncbi:OmpA family protein [Oerskovia flava]|uniref:OmpA family protein n=1 Tax=Oerskovia flava TaxID=2986422 RepID=UPI002240571F|nr:OmpA family protein [Oerskovia sp. JB1-3-2]